MAGEINDKNSSIIRNNSSSSYEHPDNNGKIVNASHNTFNVRMNNPFLSKIHQNNIPTTSSLSSFDSNVYVLNKHALYYVSLIKPPNILGKTP